MSTPSPLSILTFGSDTDIVVIITAFTFTLYRQIKNIIELSLGRLGRFSCPSCPTSAWNTTEQT